jgi:hypothetical protein
MKGVYVMIMWKIRQNCSKNVMIHYNFVHLKFRVKYLKNESEKLMTNRHSCVTEFKKRNFDNSIGLWASVPKYITAYCVVIKIRELCSRELFSECVLGLYCSGISGNRGEPRVMDDTIV